MTLSLWFKIFFAFALLGMVTDGVRYIFRNRFYREAIKLPKDKREKILQASVDLVKLCKYSFWASPLYVAAMIYLFGYGSIEFYLVLLLYSMLETVMIVKYLFRRKLITVLKNIQDDPEECV